MKLSKEQPSDIAGYVVPKSRGTGSLTSSLVDAGKQGPLGTKCPRPDNDTLVDFLGSH